MGNYIGGGGMDFFSLQDVLLKGIVFDCTYFCTIINSKYWWLAPDYIIIIIVIKTLFIGYTHYQYRITCLSKTRSLKI